MKIKTWTSSSILLDFSSGKNSTKSGQKQKWFWRSETAQMFGGKARKAFSIIWISGRRANMAGSSTTCRQPRTRHLCIWRIRWCTWFTALWRCTSSTRIWTTHLSETSWCKYKSSRQNISNFYYQNLQIVLFGKRILLSLLTFCQI